jgi:hypothetical protein
MFILLFWPVTSDGRREFPGLFMDRVYYPTLSLTKVSEVVN